MPHDRPWRNELVLPETLHAQFSIPSKLGIDCAELETYLFSLLGKSFCKIVR